MPGRQHNAEPRASGISHGGRATCEFDFCCVDCYHFLILMVLWAAIPAVVENPGLQRLLE
jgi:hypothetical protein